MKPPEPWIYTIFQFIFPFIQKTHVDKYIPNGTVKSRDQKIAFCFFISGSRRPEPRPCISDPMQ
jgi:hypothetical protein